MSAVVKEKNTTQEVVALINKSLSLNPSIRAIRQEARDAFEKMALPENKSEEYRHTPITRLLQKNFDFETSSCSRQGFESEGFFHSVC